MFLYFAFSLSFLVRQFVTGSGENVPGTYTMAHMP